MTGDTCIPQPPSTGGTLKASKKLVSTPLKRRSPVAKLKCSKVTISKSPSSSSSSDSSSEKKCLIGDIAIAKDSQETTKNATILSSESVVETASKDLEELELVRLRSQSLSRTPLSQDSWGDVQTVFGSPQVSTGKAREEEALLTAMAAEIEQLHRLREVDTRVSRFFADRIQKVEDRLAMGWPSADSYFAAEKMVMEDLELMREKVNRYPEMARCKLENSRLLEQIRSLPEFHDGGGKAVLLAGIANLRDQHLEVLDGEIAVDQGVVPWTTPTPHEKALGA